jgi:glycerol uptake facilitator-like aquaporin
VVRSLVDGDSVLVAVGSAVVTTVVTTVVGNNVGTGVISAVGTGVGIVVGRVVTGTGAACWVHPAKTTRAIRRIIKPKIFFMESKLKVTFN